jgi:hypothetical protein
MAVKGNDLMIAGFYTFLAFAGAAVYSHTSVCPAHRVENPNKPIVQSAIGPWS